MNMEYISILMIYRIILKNYFSKYYDRTNNSWDLGKNNLIFIILKSAHVSKHFKEHIDALAVGVKHLAYVLKRLLSDAGRPERRRVLKLEGDAPVAIRVAAAVRAVRRKCGTLARAHPRPARSQRPTQEFRVVPAAAALLLVECEVRESRARV